MGSGSGATPAGRLPRLILRFSLPGMLPDEVYMSRRLSIGRTPDNTFVIDDPSVDRHHAIIEVEEVPGRSEFVLCCLQPDSFVEVEGRRERRVVLQPGVRF